MGRDMARIHNREEVVELFKGHSDVKLTGDREIVISTGTTALGNKSWGKVDFLVNHCGYRLVR